MLDYVAIVHIYFWKLLVFFIQGKEKPAKTKLFLAKLCSVLVTFGFSENILSTPPSVSLCGVRLRAVLANFGFSKIIQTFSKYQHMDPKFPEKWRFSKIKKIVLLHTVLACTESDLVQC